MNQRIKKLRDAVVFFNRGGRVVKLEGLGTYAPKIDPSTPFVPRTAAARRCETASSGQALRLILPLRTLASRKNIGTMQPARAGKYTQGQDFNSLASRKDLGTMSRKNVGMI